MLKWGILYFNLCPLPLSHTLSCSIQWQSKWCLLLSLQPHQVLIYGLRFLPQHLLFSRLSSLSSLSLSSYKRCSSPLIIFVGFTPVKSASYIILASPELDPALHMWPPQHVAEGKDHVRPPADSAFPKAAQDTVCQAMRMHFWLVVSLIQQDPMAVPAELLPRCGTGHFPVLNPPSFLLARFSSLSHVPPNVSKTIWHIIHSSLFCVLCRLAQNLQRVHSVLLVRLLMRMLNSTGPSIDYGVLTSSWTLCCWRWWFSLLQLSFWKLKSQCWHHAFQTTLSLFCAINDIFPLSSHFIFHSFQKYIEGRPASNSLWLEPRKELLLQPERWELLWRYLSFLKEGSHGAYIQLFLFVSSAHAWLVAQQYWWGRWIWVKYCSILLSSSY